MNLWVCVFSLSVKGVFTGPVECVVVMVNVGDVAEEARVNQDRWLSQVGEA